MRLFIAIPLDDALTGYLRVLQDRLRSSDAKMTYVKEFHLTLKFLGEVRPDKVPLIEAALASVDVPAFTLALADVGFFPDARQPRVVWVSAGPRDTLVRLAADIDHALKAVDFPSDTRFQPHITLARVKSSRGPLGLATERHTQEAESFALIESTLSSEGPSYRTIKTFKKEPQVPV